MEERIDEGITNLEHSSFSENDKASLLRPRSIGQGISFSASEHNKVVEILSLCDSDQNVDKLIAFCSSKDGLVNDEVRKRAWPILLGYASASSRKRPLNTTWKTLRRHKDEGQVGLDVHRSFVYYPKGETDEEIDKRRQQLSDVIIQVLRQHPMLCYFQGYHDIVQVFLLVLGPHQAPEAVAHLSLLRIRDFMLPSLSPSLAHLKLLPAILKTVDSKLCQHLSTTQPFFALSATITLYAHEIQEYGDIARLFDFLIAQPAVASIYFFAVIILSQRTELFKVPAEEPEMLHSILSKLPRPLEVEALISQTVQIFNKYPPESLLGFMWWRISTYSVLKTTRWPLRDQTVRDGEKWFYRQSLQLRREEYWNKARSIIWKNRRLAARIGVTFFVLTLAYSLQRNDSLSLKLERTWAFIRNA